MNGYKTERIIVHCSNSTWGNAESIKKWHTDPKPKGNGWRDIGYNGVITNGHCKHNTEYNPKEDGMFQKGRSLDFDTYVDSDEKAAHCLGYNHNSIGICLIGKERFTLNQFITLYNF